VRDEWGKRVERHAHRQTPIAECHVGERVLAGEPRRFEPLQTGRAARAQAERALIGRAEPRLEDADEWRAPPALDANRGEGVSRSVAAIRPVEDLPVTQLPATTEPDRPRANAAERKGDLRELLSREDAGIRDSRPRRDGSCRRSLRRIGWGLRCRGGLGLGQRRAGHSRGCGDGQRLLEEFASAAHTANGVGRHDGASIDRSAVRLKADTTGITVRLKADTTPDVYNRPD
jgi:hypothetical protein